LRFNVGFASLEIKCIHHTHPITNSNHHRHLAQVRAIKRSLSAWDAFNLIVSIGAVSSNLGLSIYPSILFYFPSVLPIVPNGLAVIFNLLV